MAIYDLYGVKQVGYTYDAWGNIASITGTLASTIGTMNPFRYRSYYCDNESGMYYLNARYYNPILCRFISEDNILGANGDLLSYNLYAYCSNNPVMFVDPIGNQYVDFRDREPMGIAIGVGAGGGLLIGLIEFIKDCGKAISNLFSTSKAEEKEAEKEAEKEKTNKTNNYQTYYHATSRENARLIMLSGSMNGSKWEGGYVFAWRAKPSLEALKNSGANYYEVIIKFETTTAFETDWGIVNTKLMLYGPVRSFRPGPIDVKNVEIVEILWKN